MFERLPAQRQVGRRRDADSITMIMRRRQGYQTSNLLAARVLLLTGNEALVTSANEVLRSLNLLSPDRSTIGPALHHRVASGLLFANLGVSDRLEVSRRQLLVACAKVVILRPKLVDRLRSQISSLNRPGESALVDSPAAKPLGLLGGAISIVALNGFLWNRPTKMLNDFFQGWVDRAVKRELAQLGMGAFIGSIEVDYGAGLAKLKQ